MNWFTKLFAKTNGIQMTTINMNVGDTIPFDTSATLPVLPAGALTVGPSNQVQVTKGADNNGVVKAIAVGTSNVDFGAAAHSPGTVTFVVAAAVPKPPVLVNFGTLVPSAE